MVPTPNVSPGELVVVMVGVTPELSVAVGAVHVTATPVDPVGMATLMSDGHPEMTGAVVSMVANKRLMNQKQKHIHDRRIVSQCCNVHIKII